MDIQALIAKARAKAAEPVQQVIPVELGGELVDITLIKVDGPTWADLTAMSPLRPDSQLDLNIGYNVDAVAKLYPIGHVLVGGEPVEQETWLDILTVLEGPSLKLIAAALWGMNQNDPEKLVAELGKARLAA